MKDYLSKLSSFVNETEICCLSSVNLNGFPQTRAMLMPIKIEANKIWFHTNTSSNKIKQFKNNSKGSVYFFNQNKFEGLSFDGIIEVIEKEDEKKKFWKSEYQLYYSNGVGLEDFCILKMTLQAGEYYSNFKVETFALKI